MKRKSIIAALIVIVAVPLLCIVTLLLYVQFADLSRYKNSITAQLSQRLGREVFVAGQLDVKLFPMPALVVSQASLANAPWGSEAHMLSVQELQLRIALKPLFNAKILIDEFILADAAVLVESNADGESNWVFAAGSERPAVKEKEKSGDIKVEFTPDVRIVIERTLLRVIAGDAKPAHEYGFEQASLRGLGKGDPLSLQLAGRINQRDYTVSGSIGTLAALLSDQPYPVDLSIEALGVQSQLKGSITNPLALQRIDLKLSAKADNLNGFEPWLGENAVNAVGNVSAEFVVDGNLSEFNLRNITVSARDAKMQGQAQVKIQDGRPLIKSELMVSNFDLNQFKGAEPEPVSIQPAEKTVTDFKALGWSLEWLRSFDTVLSVHAKTLEIDQFAIESLQGDIALNQGLATVTNLQLTSALGIATANGEISVKEAQYQYGLRLNASDWNIGSLIKPIDKTAALVLLGADVELSASGNNVEQVLTALQAKAQVYYRDDAAKQYIDLKLDRHRGSNSDIAQVRIAADIHSAGENIRVNGQIGEPLLLVTPEQPYPFSLKATSAKVNGRLKGSVTQLWDRRKINAGLKVDVKGKPRLTLGTRLHGETNKYSLANINANFADGDISGEILADLTEQRPKLSGHLRAKGMRFSASAVNESAAVKEQSDSNSIEWLKHPFPKGLLSMVDADINVAAQEIVMANEQIEQADAQVRLHNKRLLLDPLHIESTLGVADAQLELAETADGYKVSLHWQSQATPLNALMANPEAGQSQSGLIDVRANIRTQGGSLYQWLENLRGTSAANYTDQPKQRKMIARLNYIESAEKKPLPVRMVLNGSKKGAVFTIAGDLDTPMRLLRDDRPFRLNLTADALGITALLRGEIKQPLAGRGIDVAINASSESLGALEQVAELPIPKLGALSLVGKIKGDFDKLNADMQADVADGFMRVSLEYDHSGGAINIKTDVTAENLDLSWIDVDETKEIEDEETAPKKLFSEAELPFGILRQLNISAKVNGENIRIPGINVKDVAFEVNNKNGKLDAKLKKLHSVEGGFTGELSIDASGDDPLVALNVEIPQLNMAKVLNRTDAKGLAQADIAFEVSLQSRGYSPAQLAAASQGRVRLLVQKGEIEAALLKFLIGGAHAMVSMVVTADAKTTKVNCGIAGLNVENGVITPEIAVLDTEYSTIVASGTVDLKTETMDLRISPLAKGKAKLNMAVPVIVKGKMSAPTVIPQAGKYIIKAGEMFAMFAMPSLAMFAAYDTLAGERPNPCLQLVNPESRQFSMGVVSGAGQAVKDVSGFFLGTINKVFGADLDEDAVDLEKMIE